MVELQREKKYKSWLADLAVFEIPALENEKEKLEMAMGGFFTLEGLHTTSQLF